MTATIAAAGAAAPAFGPLSAAAAARSRYASPEGDFSVAFPADPAVGGRPASDPDDSSFRTYAAADGGAAFAVRVDQFPDSIRPPAPDQRVYELLLRNHAVETGSRLIASTPARLGGRAGRQGAFAKADGGEEQMRVLVVGRRVYQVSYARDPASATTPAGTAFLDSFRAEGR